MSPGGYWLIHFRIRPLKDHLRVKLSLKRRTESSQSICVIFCRYRFIATQSWSLHIELGALLMSASYDGKKKPMLFDYHLCADIIWLDLPSTCHHADTLCEELYSGRIFMVHGFSSRRQPINKGRMHFWGVGKSRYIERKYRRSACFWPVNE